MQKGLKKKLAIGLITIFLVAVLIISVLQLTGVINVLAMNPTTVSYSYSFGSDEWYYEFKNLPAVRGKPGWEMTNRQYYISAWYGTRDSEVLHWKGMAEYWTKECHISLGNNFVTANSVGKYGWKVYFNELQIAGFDQTTGIGFWNEQYLSPEEDWRYDTDNPQNPFSIQKFISQKNNYYAPSKFCQDNCGCGKFSAGTSGVWIYNRQDAGEAGKWYSLDTTTVLCHFKGPKIGTVKVELWAEWQPIKHAPLCNSWSGGVQWVKLQEDQFSLQSGRGTIEILPTGNDGNDGTFTAEGTDGETSGTVYTKYHFQEGDTVSIHYQTGLSGQTSKQNIDPTVEDPYNPAEDGWTLEIFKPNNAGPIYTKHLMDNSYGTETYLVPIGSFVKGPGSNNNWKVTLHNGINDQDEIMIFVIDSRENLPPPPTIEFYPQATPQVGKEMTIKVTCGVNNNTQAAIDYFYIKARYGASGTDYVSGFNPKMLNAVSTGSGTYTCSAKLVPTKVGEIFVSAWAVDVDGRPGYIRERIIKPEEQPTYVITFKVTDATSKEPITGATVQLSGGFSEPTDADGRCAFSLMGGIYDVTITKTGYYTVTLMEQSISGTQTISIVLTSSGEGGGGGVGGMDTMTIMLYIIAGIGILVAIVGAYFYMKRKRQASK